MLYKTPDAHSTRLKFLSRIATVVFLLLSLLVFYCAYLLFRPYYPIKIVNVGTPTLVTAGESKSAQYSLSYCKRTTAVSEVYRQLIGADNNINSFAFPAIEGTSSFGCKTSKVTVPIPAGVPNGKYQLHVDLSYPVNPIRHVHVYYNTPTFAIQ